MNKKTGLYAAAIGLLILCLSPGMVLAAHKSKHAKDGHNDDEHHHHSEEIDPLVQEMMEYVKKPAYRVYLSAMTECSSPMISYDAEGRPSTNIDNQKLQSCMEKKGLPVDLRAWSPETSGEGGAGTSVRDFKQNIDNIQKILDEGVAAPVAPVAMPPSVPMQPVPALEVGTVPEAMPPETQKSGQVEAESESKGISKTGTSRPAGKFWVSQDRD